MTVLLCLILAWAPTPSPAAGNGSIERVVADELGHFDFGGRILVVARYKSQVGTRLEVEGTTKNFLLPEDKHFDALGVAKSKRGLLEMEVSSGDRGFVVHDIRETSDSRTVFQELSKNIEKHSAPRQRALIGWGFREANGRGNEFLEDLTSRWQKSGPDQIKLGRESALGWLRLSANAIGTDPRWISYANQVASQFPGDPTVIAALDELDLIETESHWRPRSLFLKELGLVESQEEVLTFEQAELRKRVEEWQAGDRQATLLRGRTTAQYKRHVQAGEAIEGMEREEVVLAWGYPKSVSWIRKGKTFYEGWFYGEREVFFTEGWVFTTQ